MPPQSATTTTTITETQESLLKPTKEAKKQTINPLSGLPLAEDIHSDYNPPLEIVWRNVALFVYLHAAALVGLGLLFTGHVKWQTFVWSKFSL